MKKIIFILLIASPSFSQENDKTYLYNKYSDSYDTYNKSGERTGSMNYNKFDKSWQVRDKSGNIEGTLRSNPYSGGFNYSGKGK
jgi:hypothetical protein